MNPLNPKESPVSLKPLKPSKSQRNSRKREIKRLLAEQQRPPKQLQSRPETVAWKPMG